MQRLTQYLLTILFGVACLSSCVTSRKVNYWQEPDKQIPSYKDTLSYEDYQLRKGDRLYICVYSIDDKITKSENGISGSRTFEWVVIPRSQGSFTIPAYQFVYFDPSSGSYSTITLPAQNIVVEKGKGSSSSFSGKDNVQLLINDIHYIHPVASLQSINDKAKVGWPFYLTALLIAALAAAAVVFGRRYQAQRGDIDGIRKKRAIRMARRRLKKAAAYLGSDDTTHFYEEIYRAIWGCLSDKYSIPLSQLNRDTVNSCLLEKHISDLQHQSIMKVLEDVDLARFAPGNPETQKQLIYDEALNMIVNLV